MSGQRLALWSLVVIAAVAAIGYRVSVFRAPPPPPAAKIMFITAGTGPYWQETVQGAKAAAAEFNVDLTVNTPPESASLSEQIETLARLNGSDWDGVALSPVDPESQTHWINKLVRQTNVVTFDSDAELSDRQSHIGASNFSAGRACARVVGEAIPEGGKIAVLIANLTQENLLDRRGGFQERIGQMSRPATEGDEPRYTIVGYFEDGGSTEKCAQNIRDVVAEHSDLAAFVGLNARHGPILLEVVGELDQFGKIALVTFDTPTETLDGIAAGHVFATIAQDPFKYGYEAVKTLATLARGDSTEIPIVGRGSTYIGFEAVKHDNVEAFRGKLRDRESAAEREGSENEG